MACVFVRPNYLATVYNKLTKQNNLVLFKTAYQSTACKILQTDLKEDSILHCKSVNYIKRAYGNLTVEDEFPAEEFTSISEEPLKAFHTFDKLLQEEFQHFSPLPMPSHSKNFADFANTSKPLQTLIMFGVNLFAVRKKFPDSCQFLVTLDQNKELKPKLKFLKNIGITPAEFGEVLTKNITLLDPKLSVDDLQETIDYLTSKKFTKMEITSIIARFPQIFDLSIPRLDGVLGFYQNLPTNYENRPIHFKANDLRTMIIKCPRLITASLEEVYLVVKMLEKSCLFTIGEIRQLFLERPQILLSDGKNFAELFKFYANEMNLSNEQIVRNPFIFDTRLKLITARHYYLKSLKRNVYDEKMPGYLSLHNIVRSTNEEFCKNCGLGPLANFEKFMRTI